MTCNHKICGNTEKLWLPYEPQGHLKGLKPHSYCVCCGAVKSISSDKIKPLGYYMNALSGLPISKVQTRLIAKDLEAFADFEDAFSMSKFSQELVFLNIVRKYSGLSEHIIKEAL